jgi:epoxyqueuosine reductase
MPEPSSQALTIKVKEAARRLGFDLVGITDPSAPHHLDVYQRWIEVGRHGGMSYLATERAYQARANPNLLLPDCRSIVIVGVNYLSRALPESKGKSQFKVAAYAQGDDYHDVLVPRLEQLAAILQAQQNRSLKYRIYTDTGPILERELGQRAGLGWVGKNTCLINPSLGSNFLLAELLVDVELVPDIPFQADRCGSCTRCIDACPTSCILPNRTLDARRCISYLTIEAKGVIAKELRPAIGNWIFGCDICQQVCPWNIRFASPTNDPTFQPRDFLKQSKLLDFLQLSPDSWTRSLRGSPLLRPRRRGLLRNAATVAGNSGDSSLIPQLEYLLIKDPEPIVRAHAAWALGRIGGEISRRTLKQAHAKESHTQVVVEISDAIRASTD